VNCLAVPDAFLAHKDYATALSEYRRIGSSFPGRAEGREAMFRAGITLLEQAGGTEDPQEKAFLYDAALEEFEKLHMTPGAPLEYLGKALVYQALKEHEEELKCFELAYRRFPQHPLLLILQEQISYRIQESSRVDRRLTYAFILLTVRHIPQLASTSHTVKLLNNLIKHWEPLYFIEEYPAEETSQKLQNIAFATPLAFWLAKPYILGEIIEELAILSPLPLPALWNGLFSLIELGGLSLAQEILGHLEEKLLSTSQTEAYRKLSLLSLAFLPREEGLEHLRGKLLEGEEKIFLHLLEACQDEGKTALIHHACSLVDIEAFRAFNKHRLNCIRIWAHLLDKEWDKAGTLLNEYPLEWLQRETSLLYFLYGCWLTGSEGKDLAHVHFEGVMEVPYPRSWTLGSHFLIGSLSGDWFKNAFAWEKRQLYRQLSLYYACLDDAGKARHFSKLAEQSLAESSG
jgi:serine/threonine-protein kinase